MTEAVAAGDDRSAAQQLRETAKWMVVSVGAIGAVLAAGLQVSALGALEVTSLRFVMAVLGGGMAVWAALLVLSSALAVMAAPRVTYRQLVEGSSAAVDEVVRDELYLLEVDDLRALDDALRAASRVREGVLERWDSLSEEEKERAQASAQRADGDVVHLAAVAERIVARSAYERTLGLWQVSRRRMLHGVAFGAAGIFLFAWSSNPPADDTLEVVVTTR